MTNKVDVKDFIFELLQSAHLRNVHLSGHNIHCQCPFHMPKRNTSAFGVSFTPHKDDDSFYPFNCQSCGVKGDIIYLIAHVSNCNFQKAKKLFLRRVLQTQVNLNSLRAVWRHYTARQTGVEGQSRVNLPVAAKDQHTTVKYLNYRSALAHDLLDVDLLVNRYKLYYCDEGRMKNRIIMPIKDLHGNVVSYNDRSVILNEKKKSLHSNGEEIGSLIYGLFEALGKKKCVVVEGAPDLWQIMSVLKKHKRFHNFGCVALMGTTLTEERKELLISLFDEIYIMLDNEPEAVTKSKKMMRMLENEIMVHNVTDKYTPGKDPGQCFEEEIIEALSKAKTQKRRTYLEYLEGIIKR